MVGSGRLPRRGGEFLTGGYAFYQIYETGDKRFVSLGAIENKFWRIFCERIGRPEYIDMQWDMERQEEMKAGIQTIMKQKTQKEWVQIFADVEICFTPVLNLDEVYEHPQVKAREMMMRMPDINNSGKDMVVPGLPIKFSATPGEVKLKFPELGEHTSEVLQGVGYTTEEIELFKINGIV
jgi:crotonobetainyl-CoA:carnitine CoA-transferase CaiB-like acyl-CoA transferase